MAAGRVMTTVAASAGITIHGLLLAAFGVPLVLLATPAQAACTMTNSGQTQTFTYSAGNLGNDAQVSFSTDVKCTGSSDGTAICYGSIFTSSVVSGSNSMPFRIDIDDTTHGVTDTDISNNGTMYGPHGTLNSTGSSTTKLTVNAVVAAGAATSAGVQAGTYSQTFPIHIDMTTGTCDSYGANTSDSATASFTAKYVVPASCSLITTPAIDFGTIGSVGPLAARRDAQGSIVIRCNAANTVYIDDGKNRVSSGSGNRQMAKAGFRLPYQLYKDANRTQIWDATGGTSSTGGSGGVSSTGTGGNATLTVYASIPAGITLPNSTGIYQDTVVITVTY